MKISIIGSGYVGLVTGACFAELGHTIIFVDIDPKKIQAIEQGIPPIYEEGLEEILHNNSDRISATTDYAFAINNSEITFICVGTPSREDGSIDTQYVQNSAECIGEVLKKKDSFHTVIVKSTVIPGTTENIVLPALEKTSGKSAFSQEPEFGLGYNPEFLKEGVAIKDFLNPDRIVLGYQDPITGSVMKDLYNDFLPGNISNYDSHNRVTKSCPLVEVSIATAEMIKYASNAFLATKISFANEIGNLCKSYGIDTAEVFSGVGLDARINPAFFGSGIGFGGSCFPKDVRALAAAAEAQGLRTDILRAVLSVNESQPERMITLLKRHLPDLKNKKIGVLGLAFKPDTDDIRESRAIPVISALLKQGAQVVAYDPLAHDTMRTVFPDICYVDSAKEVLNECDAVLLTTAWKEFETLDFSGKIVIDGRRVESLRDQAEVYEGVCW